QRLALAFDRPDLRGLVRVRDDALIVHPAVRLGLGESAHRQRDQPDQTRNRAELHGGPPQCLTRPKSRSAAEPYSASICLVCSTTTAPTRRSSATGSAWSSTRRVWYIRRPPQG